MSFVVVALLIGTGVMLLAEDDKPIAVSPQEIEQAVALKAREEALNEQEKQLAGREQEAEAVKKEVDEKLTKVTTTQADIQNKLQGLTGVQDKQFKNLVKIYSTMSASKVAPLLDTMDEPSAVKILRAMKYDAVAKIIPKLEKERAVRISKQLGLME